MKATEGYESQEQKENKCGEPDKRRVAEKLGGKLLFNMEQRVRAADNVGFSEV